MVIMDWRAEGVRAPRQERHHMVNDLIALALPSAGIPAVLEPSIQSSFNPMANALTEPPSYHGPVVRHWCGILPTPDTFAVFAVSHLINTSCIAGAAESVAESRKKNKYSAFSLAHIFVPVAMETMGV